MNTNMNFTRRKGMISLGTAIAATGIVLGVGTAIGRAPVGIRPVPPPSRGGGFYAYGTGSASSQMLYPSRGPIGTAVTVIGGGFTQSSTVRFDGLAGARVEEVAPNGSWLVFDVPSMLSPICDPREPCPQFIRKVTDGTYEVKIVTGRIVMDAGGFTVTGAPGRIPSPQPPSSGGGDLPEPTPPTSTGGTLPMPIPPWQLNY